MKKFRSFIVFMLLSCILLVALASCNGNGKDNGENGSGNGAGSGNIASGNESGTSSDVGEIGRLRHVMGVVLSEFSSRLTTSTPQLSADVEGGELQQVFGYLDSVGDKQVMENNDRLNTLAIKNFIAVLAYGELLSKVRDTNQIYDTPIEVNMGEDVSPSTGHVVIKSEGTRIIAYLYAKDDAKEVVYKYDIDYVSDDKFSAKMITLSNSEIVYYLYGDTDGNSLLMMGDTLTYKAQDSDTCYQSTDDTVLENCFSRVNHELADIDFTLIRSLKDSCEYTSTYSQYMDIADKLCEQYGVK